MQDLVDVNGGPKIIHFTLCLFSLLPSALELWSEEGPRMHTDKHAQQFTQTAEWVMECVCLCVRAFRPFLTAREWSQSAIIPSEVEGSLLDRAIHQP